jgi:hypothetical protein
MTTPEGKIKAKVSKVFKKYGVYYHMPVMNGMGAPTLDFIACCNGHYVTVETKAPGKHPTARQQITMAEVQCAGGFVFVVSCQIELDRLEAFLMLLHNPAHIAAAHLELTRP